MTTRFADRGDIYTFISRTPDFKIRHHGSIVLWLTYAFGLSLLGIVGALFYVFYRISIIYAIEQMPIKDILMSATFVVMIMVILAGYVYLVIKKIRMVVLATEFLNMLLAGSSRIDSIFCIIFSNKKEVAYADDKATGYFINDKVNNLDELLKSLLSHKGISSKNQKLLEDAIKSDKKAEAAIKFTDSDGNECKAKILLQPISNLKGFFVMRGYKA